MIQTEYSFIYHSQSFKINTLTKNPYITKLKYITFQNIVGKGENDGYQHFHLFLSCFYSFKREIHWCSLQMLPLLPCQKILLSDFELTLSQTTNLRVSQIERVCRRQFQGWWKWLKVFQMDRKHCGKRRNCSLRAISPFPTVFSSLVLQTRKNKGLFGKWWKSK